jgi:uncharacterized protein
MSQSLAPRLRHLPTTAALGHEVSVAQGLRARLLGLAFLSRGQVGGGLLIPRCASVHTFGMRFELDLFFLGERGEPLVVRRRVPPCRVVFARSAAAVLEVPSLAGGEFSSRPT